MCKGLGNSDVILMDFYEILRKVEKL